MKAQSARHESRFKDFVSPEVKMGDFIEMLILVLVVFYYWLTSLHAYEAI
jgi:hypothetical protein